MDWKEKVMPVRRQEEPAKEVVDFGERPPPT